MIKILFDKTCLTRIVKLTIYTFINMISQPGICYYSIKLHCLSVNKQSSDDVG